MKVKMMMVLVTVMMIIMVVICDRIFPCTCDLSVMVSLKWCHNLMIVVKTRDKIISCHSDSASFISIMTEKMKCH